MIQKTILLGFVFLISLVNVEAQNYSPIISGNTSLFIYPQTGYIQALHVDSTKADPKGLAHYFLKTFDAKDENHYCYDFIPSWSGSKMIAAGNTYYFFNKDEDTIKILPLSEIDIPWTFYKYSNGDYIEAKITAKELLSFLSISDSVKTISLTRKTIADVIVSDPVNALSFQISKQHGFIKMISFSRLPDSDPSYDLVGLSQPQAGQQLLTPRRIYDFNVNDEFHYQTNYFNVPISGHSDKTIRKVIGKYTSLNTDTVIYTIQQSKETINYTVTNEGRETVASDPIYTVTTFDEKYIFTDTTIYPGIYLDKFGEHGTPINYGLYRSSSNGDKLILEVNLMQGVFYSEESNCWQHMVDGPANYVSYMEGCGYYEMNRDVFPSSDNSKLVYYKKGNDTHGEALVLSTFTKATSQALTLYPNPLKQGEELHISTAHFNASKLMVYNSTGNKVWESTLVKEEDLQTVDLGKLQQGLYVMQLLNDKNEFLTSIFIIK